MALTSVTSISSKPNATITEANLDAVFTQLAPDATEWLLNELDHLYRKTYPKLCEEFHKHTLPQKPANEDQFKVDEQFESLDSTTFYQEDFYKSVNMIVIMFESRFRKQLKSNQNAMTFYYGVSDCKTVKFSAEEIDIVVEQVAKRLSSWLLCELDQLYDKVYPKMRNQLLQVQECENQICIDNPLNPLVCETFCLNEEWINLADLLYQMIILRFKFTLNSTQSGEYELPFYDVEPMKPPASFAIKDEIKEHEDVYIDRDNIAPVHDYNNENDFDQESVQTNRVRTQIDLRKYARHNTESDQMGQMEAQINELEQQNLQIQNINIDVHASNANENNVWVSQSNEEEQILSSEGTSQSQQSNEQSVKMAKFKLVASTKSINNIEQNHNHKRTHKCEWPDCEKVFRVRSEMLKHQRIHTGDRPYKCTWPDCSLSFIQSSHLNIHVLIHKGERPHKCTWPDCLKSFTQSNDLTRHLLFHKGERPHKCTWPDCLKSFTLASHLKKHVLRHKGERPHQCTWQNCEKSFTQSDDLTKHLLIHKGERPHKCTWQDCSRSFTQSSHLKGHLLTHTSERSQTCQFENCTKKYKDKGSLHRHYKEKHKFSE